MQSTISGGEKISQTCEYSKNLKNLGLKGRIEQQDKDLDMYKETLKRLYVVYVEQQKLVEV